MAGRREPRWWKLWRDRDGAGRGANTIRPASCIQACVEGYETLGGTHRLGACRPCYTSNRHRQAAEFSNSGIRVGPELDLAQMMKRKGEGVACPDRGVDLFPQSRCDGLRRACRRARPGQRPADGAQLGARHRHLRFPEQAPLPGVPMDQPAHLVSPAPWVGRSTRHTGYRRGVIGLDLVQSLRRLGTQVPVRRYIRRICPGLDGEATGPQRAQPAGRTVSRLGTPRSRYLPAVAAGRRLDLRPAAGGAPESLQADTCCWLAIGRALLRGLGWRRSAWRSISMLENRDSAARRGRLGDRRQPRDRCWH